MLAVPRIAFLAVLALAAGGCAAEARRGQPHEYLDERTAATITAVDQPLVFARERTDLAANARDYVTLAAAAVDRGGKVQYVLIAYGWSTVDSRLSQERPPLPDTVVVAADDRRLLFAHPSGSPADAGIARPVGAPPGPARTPYVFGTDLATLRYLAAARHLSLRLSVGEGAPVYEIWADGRAALGAWAQALEGAR